MKAEENAYAFLFDHYFFNRWRIVSHINSQVLLSNSQMRTRAEEVM